MSTADRFQRFAHPCMEPACREREICISYGLSKDRPTVLERDTAVCPACGSSYSLRLGAPEANGVRVHIKQIVLSE